MAVRNRTMPRRVSRRTFGAALALAVAGCAGDDGYSPEELENPAVGDVSQMGGLQLTSPAFEAGEPIPQKYGNNFENVNPPLSIANVPTEAESLTLIMDDPDAMEPAGQVFLHWLVWNIPPSWTEIPEAWEPTNATVGVNDFDNQDYNGPAPPDETHSYRFKLYALDSMLDVDPSASKEAVGEAMQESILAQTQLEGTYSP
jgi:Raf kinase inhibitor-like YbhB/YbcL family protein